MLVSIYPPSQPMGRLLLLGWKQTRLSNWTWLMSVFTGRRIIELGLKIHQITEQLEQRLLCRKLMLDLKFSSHFHPRPVDETEFSLLEAEIIPWIRRRELHGGSSVAALGFLFPVSGHVGDGLFCDWCLFFLSSVQKPYGGVGVCGVQLAGMSTAVAWPTFWSVGSCVRRQTLSWDQFWAAAAADATGAVRVLCSLTGAPLNEPGVNVDSLSCCGRLVEEDVSRRRPECVSVTPCWRAVSETTSHSSAELLLFVLVAVSLLEDSFFSFSFLVFVSRKL